MNNTNTIYFRFLRFSLGLYEGREFIEGTALNSFDWQAFYEFSLKQTLLGVMFDGIQRLPKEAAPDGKLLMQWFAMSRRIAANNELLNRATLETYHRIKSLGYNCCILKGQGNAAIYPNPSARTPGDVDVWTDATGDEAARLAAKLVEKSNGRVGETSVNHVEMTMNGISVELHTTPGFMANPVCNGRLQRWFIDNFSRQCNNMEELSGGVGKMAVPTAAFNAIYQLYHLYHHYFYEGVGLRQVVDYHFVVSRLFASEYDAAEIEKIRRNLKKLGLWQFARAVMYVLHEVMGLSTEKMITPVDTKRGELFLDDILNGGNFGHYDRRFAVAEKSGKSAEVVHRGALRHNLLRLERDVRLLRYYPSEALSEPLFRLWHWCWRKRRNGKF